MKCDMCGIEPNDVLYMCDVADDKYCHGEAVCHACLIKKLHDPTWVLMELYTTDPKSHFTLGDADAS